MRYLSEDPSLKICQLLDGGDWACAFGQCGTLSHVCQELAALLDDPELAEKARQVAREANRDLGVAARQWGELAGELRRPGGRPGSRSESGADLPGSRRSAGERTS